MTQIIDISDSVQTPTVQPVTDPQAPVISGTVTMDSVENKDSTADTGSPVRVNQQQMLPTSVPARVTAGLFSTNPDSYALGTGNTGSILVLNSTSASFIFTVSSNNDAPIIAVPDVAFYIGQTVGPDTQWPSSAFGMGNMPVSVFNDWGLTDNHNVATRAIIRNNTGFDQFVICVCRFRIITNPSTTPQTGSNFIPIPTSTQFGEQPGTGG